MPEKLPVASDGISTKVTKNWVSGRGESVSTVKSGVNSDVSALYEAAKNAALNNSLISGLDFVDQNGRGTFTMLETPSQLDPAISDKGNQELLAIDVIRPIYASPYFDGLIYSQIAEVRKATESGVTEVVPAWAALQKTLFYHIIMGRTKYYETAYVFRKTFRTSSNTALNRVASNVNTVQPLPALSTPMQNLIDSLPEGEWLKRPVQCRYVGKKGFDVSEEYLWSPKWSVVYGGSFTGVS